MGKAIEAFEQDFAPWGVRLPADAVSARRSGHLAKAGWSITYDFGRDKRGEFLDYYAALRTESDDAAPDDRHARLYDTGDRIVLPTVLEAYMYARDPTREELERARRHIPEPEAVPAVSAPAAPATPISPPPPASPVRTQPTPTRSTAPAAPPRSQPTAPQPTAPQPTAQSSARPGPDVAAAAQPDIGTQVGLDPTLGGFEPLPSGDMVASWMITPPYVTAVPEDADADDDAGAADADASETPPISEKARDSGPRAMEALADYSLADMDDGSIDVHFDEDQVGSALDADDAAPAPSPLDAGRPADDRGDALHDGLVFYYPTSEAAGLRRDSAETPAASGTEAAAAARAAEPAADAMDLAFALSPVGEPVIPQVRPSIPPASRPTAKTDFVSPASVGGADVDAARGLDPDGKKTESSSESESGEERGWDPVLASETVSHGRRGSGGSGPSRSSGEAGAPRSAKAPERDPGRAGATSRAKPSARPRSSPAMSSGEAIGVVDVDADAEMFRPWWYRTNGKRALFAAAAIVIIALASMLIGHHSGRARRPATVRADTGAQADSSLPAAASNSSSDSGPSPDTAAAAPSGTAASTAQSPDRQPDAAAAAQPTADDGMAQPAGPQSVPPIVPSRREAGRQSNSRRTP